MNYNNSALRILIITLLATAFSACGGDSDKDVDSLEIESTPVAIDRLDKVIEGYIDLDSLQRVAAMRDNAVNLTLFGAIVSPEIDTITNTVMNMWSTWPATTVFMPEVNKIYETVKPEQAAIGEIMARADANGLKLPYNRFVTVTWGIDKSIVLADSTVIIALNHYLGPLNEAYNGWPEYRRRLKTRDMIPVDVTEAMIATTYPDSASEYGTVLQGLVREGAMAVAKQRLNPRMSPAYALGFTPEQLKDISSHEAFMWKSLVTNNLLYSTDAEVRAELFKPRPATRIISEDAPGRAVRYLGYRIVESYLARHPDTPLASILAPSFAANAENVLRESGYNPR